jgi:carbon monoxide dehydrogenase subunit G
VRTARARELPAAPAAVWGVAGDPAQLPRWWPGVVRVEGADPESFTQVHRTAKGRTVRADFRIASRRAEEELVCVQLLDGTPFARLLSASQVAVRLAPAGAGTRVELELRQSWRGVARLGALLGRAAGRRRLDEALDGLAAAV